MLDNLTINDLPDGVVDVVEVIDVGKERHAAQHTEHNRCYNNQSCNVWHGFSSCSVKSKSSFQSLRVGVRISDGIPFSTSLPMIRSAAC